MLDFPLLTSAHVNECDISSWYKTFQHLTINSKILPLPKEFIDYLLSDNIHIPGLTLTPQGEYDVDSDQDDIESVQSESQINDKKFTVLDFQIQQSIRELGGSIFPKLNWTSPKDASWIMFGNTLKCTTEHEIYLLLKSSDFIMHDLKHSYENCIDEFRVDINLCLREWNQALNPALEFRCFIRDRILVGICQRDTRNYYPEISRNSDFYFKRIMSFFIKNVQSVFRLENYVLDLYFTQDDMVRIMDFNPFSINTDSLLFQWDELLGLTQEATSIRCVESESDAQGIEPAYTFNRLPKEAFDFSKDGASLADFAKRLQEEIIASETTNHLDNLEIEQ
jgi:hypothetical protein